MMPVVVANTYGEREAEAMLVKAWELMGGLSAEGIRVCRIFDQASSAVIYIYLHQNLFPPSGQNSSAAVRAACLYSRPSLFPESFSFFTLFRRKTNPSSSPVR